MHIINQIKKIYRFIRKNSYNTKSDFRESPGKNFIPPLSLYPSMIMIDTTTRCNLACKHCPSNKLSKIPGYLGDMDIDLYKKIVCEVAQENKKTIIRPFDGGEPFMRKDIEELIKYAKNKGVEYISINTNGLLMTPERCEKLLESKLDHIEISIDAVSPETYLKIRGSRYYEKLLKNIDYLNKLRVNKNSKLRITVSFVKQRENFTEERPFISFWQNKVDNVSIREYHQHNKWIDGSGAYKKRTETTRYPCPYLWERLIINHNGKVRFCESDWLTDQTLVGDVNKQSIKEIWLSDLYQQVRQSHLNRTFQHPFCVACSDWQEIRW
jgi:radical SAM protein with 4Fe4S-binding SPASM domain